MDVNDAVIDGSTRAEIEQRVCDRLFASDSYQFAWVSAVNSEMKLERRAVAGADDRPGDRPLVCDPDDTLLPEETSEMVRTREMQISRTDAEDASSNCRDAALERGLQATASIPIVHENTLIGVIGVASSRARAFEAQEGQVVARLGEVVGHAIAAVERKRALLSDDVIEVSFRMRNIEELGLPKVDSGRVVFDRIVPIGDGEYRQFGTATGETMESVRALTETDLTPHSRPLTVIESGSDETRFELRLVDPPFLPAIADVGGYIQDARIAEGKYTIRVHLPASADVRNIVDVVTDAYPAAQMVSRRQTKRQQSSVRQIEETFFERLTDRQRTVLETAYAKGFFAVPRQCSGEDVAQSLGITTSTFHQHLRKAQLKLLAVTFDDVDS